MKNNGVMILDFGSQYTKLIARRVREENIYSEIFKHNISIDEVGVPLKIAMKLTIPEEVTPNNIKHLTNLVKRGSK